MPPCLAAKCSNPAQSKYRNITIPIPASMITAEERRRSLPRKTDRTASPRPIRHAESVPNFHCHWLAATLLLCVLFLVIDSTVMHLSIALTIAEKTKICQQKNNNDRICSPGQTIIRRCLPWTDSCVHPATLG